MEGVALSKRGKKLGGTNCHWWCHVPLNRAHTHTQSREHNSSAPGAGSSLSRTAGEGHFWWVALVAAPEHGRHAVGLLGTVPTGPPQQLPLSRCGFGELKSAFSKPEHRAKVNKRMGKKQGQTRQQWEYKPQSTGIEGFRGELGLYPGQLRSLRLLNVFSAW